jgi:hypothetical protein
MVVAKHAEMVVKGKGVVAELTATVSASDSWITAWVLTYNATKGKLKGSGTLKYTVAANSSNKAELPF